MITDHGPDARDLPIHDDEGDQTPAVDLILRGTALSIGSKKGGQ